MILGLVLNFSNISSQNLKNDCEGNVSSSRIIPISSSLKNQSIAVFTAFPQPKFFSRKRVFTSHGQSTAVAISRTFATRSASPAFASRGPSAATYNRGGFACRMASNTIAVVSGRLKTRNSTAVCRGAGGAIEDVIAISLFCYGLPPSDVPAAFSCIYCAAQGWRMTEIIGQSTAIS